MIFSFHIYKIEFSTRMHRSCQHTYTNRKHFLPQPHPQIFCSLLQVRSHWKIHHYQIFYIWWILSKRNILAVEMMSNRITRETYLKTFKEGTSLSNSYLSKGSGTESSCKLAIGRLPGVVFLTLRNSSNALFVLTRMGYLKERSRREGRRVIPVGPYSDKAVKKFDL